MFRLTIEWPKRARKRRRANGVIVVAAVAIGAVLGPAVDAAAAAISR